MREVQILSTGKYVPAQIVTNKLLSDFVDTSDEWICSRTGISERRISKMEKTSELATKAALDALKRGNVSPEEIELIIVATTTPDCFTPSTACIVQDNINAKNAVCFDISAACTGFIYALTIACQFIKNDTYKKALIIGAETLSRIVDWNDRSTCVLFGDGAGAAILESSQETGVLQTYIASDGNGGKLLRCNATSTFNINNVDLGKELFGRDYENMYEYEKDEQFLQMEGRKIFKFAVSVIEQSITKILRESRIRIEDIKYIIPHQANLRIIDHVSKKLKIPEEKFYTNLQYYGNTSAASIPIALAEMNEKSMIKRKDKIIVVGFGGGLTWGSALIEW